MFFSTIISFCNSLDKFVGPMNPIILATDLEIPPPPNWFRGPNVYFLREFPFISNMVEHVFRKNCEILLPFWQQKKLKTKNFKLNGSTDLGKFVP